MKANAPEKLYLHPTAKNNVGASWLTFPLTDNDIEYVRKDVFIEEICEWIRDNHLKYPSEDCADTAKFIKDFRNHMKGK